jgi:hypothetical protein
MGLLRWWLAGSMPSPCFISHAYQDEEIVRDLLERLPGTISPFIFPPIKVPPDERVSDDLVKAILQCPGLIYILGGRSSESEWVSFERDYARRARKLIFSYDAKIQHFARDSSAPLALPVFPSYAGKDRSRVQQVTHFMQKRYFDVWTEESLKPGSSFVEETSRGLETRLASGGYVVSFISKHVIESVYVRAELEFAAKQWPKQILHVLLDPIELERLPLVFQTTAPVVLHRESGPDSGLNWNSIDDLIVRIYDLVYRNSRRQRAAGEAAERPEAPQ